jgi:hypothetical protein
MKKEIKTWTYTGAILLTLCTLNTLWASAQTSPLYHWRLNETSGTFARDDISGHDATMMGSPTCGLPGAYGTAYSFDGVDDYLLTARQFEKFGCSNFTLAAWVNFTAEQTKVAPILFYQSAQALIIFSMSWNDRPYVFLQNYETTGWVDLNGTTALNDGRWHLIAVVRTNHTAILYVDGITESSKTNSLLGVLGGTGNIRIGGKPGTPLDVFHGLIDDVSIFDTALSATEIENMANLRRPAEFLNISVTNNKTFLTFETSQALGVHDVQQSDNLLEVGSWHSVRLGSWTSSVVTVEVQTTNNTPRAFFRLKTTY